MAVIVLAAGWFFPANEPEPMSAASAEAPEEPTQAFDVVAGFPFSVEPEGVLRSPPSHREPPASEPGGEDLPDEEIAGPDGRDEPPAPGPFSSTRTESAVPPLTETRKNEPAQVVIIIDDMGMDRKRSLEMMALPAPLTLAFLPYAPHVGAMAAEARETGHEIMVHMPMEPMNPDLDTGPLTLRTDETPAAFLAILDESLSNLDGYVGLNNHMGSRLTQEREAMALLMDALKTRGLLFVDSRTIATSVAFDVAGEYGVPRAQRDVFLDHTPTIEGVRAALAHTERIAREHGTAIAIGHPKDATLAGLKEWLPTLATKGITIVPVSQVVDKGQES